MSGKKLAPAISVYENVFDGIDFVKAVEEETNEEFPYLSWNDAVTGGGIQSNYRTSRNCEIGKLMGNVVTPRLQPLVVSMLTIVNKIDKCVWDYRDEYSLELNSNQGFSLLKYGGGGQYFTHVDHWSGGVDGIRDSCRILSLVAYVNDDYTGGELEFPVYDVKIKPTAGSVVLFPSNFPFEHMAHPVGVSDDSVKYSIVTWFV